MSHFGELLGFALLERRAGFARLALTLRPDLHNRSGIAHGGVLMALLDEAGGHAGALIDAGETPRSCVTVDLSCHFTGQQSEGQIIASANVVRHGRNLYFCQIDLHDAAGELLAFAAATYRWRSRK